MRRLISPVLVILVLLLTWELLLGQAPEWHLVLPSPSRVFAAMWIGRVQLAVHLFATMKLILGGLVLAFFVAFPLAIVMALFQGVLRVLQPVVVLSQCLPMFALAPLMVVWFGWTYTATLVPTALMVFFPLVVNIYQGMSSTPQCHLDFFRLQHASVWQTLWKLRLPFALPQLCAGLRIAITWAVMGAVVGEWAGAQQGLGILMLESRRSADLATAFGAIFVLMALGMVGMGVSQLLESWMTRILRSSNTHRWLRYISVGLCSCFAFLLLLLGWGSHESVPHRSRLVLDWLPNPNHVPLYVGVHLGIFQQYGLDLEILKVHDPGDPLPYLASGQAEFALTYMPSLVLHERKGGFPFCVAGYLVKEPLNALIFRKTLEIENLSQLDHQVIGYSTDAIQSEALRQMVSENGLDHASLINVNFDLVTMLGAEKVDAIFGAYWNIETEHLAQLGIEADFISVTNLGLPSYHELLVVATNPDLQEPFRQALGASIQFCRDEPQKALSLYFGANPDKTADSQEWEARAWQRTLPALAKDQEDEPEVWQQLHDWMDQHHL